LEECINFNHEEISVGNSLLYKIAYIPHQELLLKALTVFLVGHTNSANCKNYSSTNIELLIVVFLGYDVQVYRRGKKLKT
jgi:hypothetical protein